MEVLCECLVKLKGEEGGRSKFATARATGTPNFKKKTDHDSEINRGKMTALFIIYIYK